MQLLALSSRRPSRDLLAPISSRRPRRNPRAAPQPRSPPPNLLPSFPFMVHPGLRGVRRPQQAQQASGVARSSSPTTLYKLNLSPAVTTAPTIGYNVEEFVAKSIRFEELSDIKSALNSEIEQLRSGFQELRTTLRKQQEDVSISLKNLGLQDATENDGTKGSRKENTSEGVSANLENLKLDDNHENHDESRGVKEEKNIFNNWETNKPWHIIDEV